MDNLSYKTLSANSKTVKKNWYIIDAEDQVLGRLSSQIANVLRGKTKPDYTPNVDCGDNVIIINAEKIRLTGKKMDEKIYTRHTGYPGGQRFSTPKQLLAKFPERILQKAIKGMLPRTKLGAAIMGNLYVYAGTSHPHEAQKPQVKKF